MSHLWKGEVKRAKIKKTTQKTKEKVGFRIPTFHKPGGTSSAELTPQNSISSKANPDTKLPQIS